MIKGGFDDWAGPFRTLLPIPQDGRTFPCEPLQPAVCGFPSLLGPGCSAAVARDLPVAA